jgi:hypothetical protein
MKSENVQLWRYKELWTNFAQNLIQQRNLLHGKCKLDDLRDVLGDDLYESKLQQLRNEFLQAAAL